MTAAEVKAPQIVRLDDALLLARDQVIADYRAHLNPRFTALLRLIDADVPLIRAAGPFVWDSHGNRYLDLVAGFASMSFGHNHPRFAEAMEQVNSLPNLAEGLNPVVGALARSLASIAPEGLQRVFFANSGAEVVDAAIKLARVATGRARLVACDRSFHGRTLGALSVMGRREFREPFAPLLADVTFVPFGDGTALEAALRSRAVAAFIVEPIQSEAGVIIPPSGYLKRARDLCTKYGTLLVADEIQTGLGRTGSMFAVDHDDVVPDALLLGKALGGGVMPLSALLTSERVWRQSKSGTISSPFYTSTYGGNTRACAAGLIALELLQREGLVERSVEEGAHLLRRLQQVQSRHRAIVAVRGRGLIVGIEFAPAGGTARLLGHDILTALVIKEMLNRHRIMTLSMLNNTSVLRVEPPLNIAREHLDCFVDGLDEILLRLEHPATAMRPLAEYVAAASLLPFDGITGWFRRKQPAAMSDVGISRRLPHSATST